MQEFKRMHDPLEKILTNEFIDLLKKKIIRHEEEYRTKIIADQLEDIFSQCLEKIGFTNDWFENRRSHRPGVDIILDENKLKISCKSGVIAGNSLSITSYRTSSKKSLEDKINFISLPHEDIIFSLAENDKNKFYTFIAYPKPELSNLNWETAPNGDTHSATDVHGNSFRINSPTTSGQLVMKLNLKTFTDWGFVKVPLEF
jgi:hypothetical protein